MPDHIQPASPADPDRATLTEIEFRSFKALGRFDVNLRRANILVGPNNCGKSTIIGALRLLAAGMRKARSVKPEWIQGDTDTRYGWELAREPGLISLENVHTDYSDVDTTVTFKFSNANSLKLLFPRGGGCRMIPGVASGRQVKTIASFKESFPFKLAVIPILGPLEHNEQLVRKETVQQNLLTHRASRNFRNYWLHFPDGFDEFAELVRTTWPGMDVTRPYEQNIDPREVFMFAEENRIRRELYWCGYGFQIWCQLLTNIARNRDADLLVVDEPEIYLHPDVQRQLVGVLRDAGPAVVLATHSTEIMAEADPSEVILVDKERTAGRRLQNPDAVQAALAHIGSIHNISLIQAARNRRVVYVEDTRDYATIKRFAKALGLSDLASTTSITPLPSGGYGSWKEIVGVAKRIEDATGTRFRIGAVYDRDYRCDAELSAILAALREHLDFAWILEFKEIENYLLNPAVLDRVIAAQMRAAGRPPIPEEEIGSAALLTRITDSMRHDVLSQYITRRNEYMFSRGIDLSTPTKETAAWLDEQWSIPEKRLAVIPGKQTLRTFRGAVSDKYSVSFSDGKVAEAFKKTEVPNDMRALAEQIEAFSCKE